MTPQIYRQLFSSTSCSSGLLIRPQAHQSALKRPADLCGLPLSILDPPDTYSDLPPIVLGPLDAMHVY